jgi:hypothetical protein
MAVCTHLDQIKLTDPAGPIEGCQECLKTGGRWVHLRSASPWTRATDQAPASRTGWVSCRTHGCAVWARGAALRRAGYHPCRPAVIGCCDARHVSAPHLGGRPSGGRMGAMAGPPWWRGPDHSAGTASTAAATA